MVRFPVLLEPGSGRCSPWHWELEIPWAAASTGARNILRGQAGEAASLAPLARKLSLTERQGIEAFQLLSRLSAAEEPGERPPKSALWPYGISGDFPLAVGPVTEGEGARTGCPLVPDGTSS